jgi:hypothetical protein
MRFAFAVLPPPGRHASVRFPSAVMRRNALRFPFAAPLHGADQHDRVDGAVIPIWAAAGVR